MLSKQEILKLNVENYTTVGPLLSTELNYPRYLSHNLVRPSTADNRGPTVQCLFYYYVEVIYLDIQCLVM